MCLLYVNHKIFFGNIYTTPKFVKINFEEICITVQIYIWKLKKKRKNHHFSQHDFQNLIHCAHHCARAYYVRRSEIRISLLKKFFKENFFFVTNRYWNPPKMFFWKSKIQKNFPKNVKKQSFLRFFFFEILYFVPYAYTSHKIFFSQLKWVENVKN